MKILIIGGTGFISFNLVKVLCGRNHSLTVFNRGNSRTVLEGWPEVEFYKGDRNCQADLEGVLKKNGPYDVIYDMVAYEPAQSELSASVFYGCTGHFIHCSTVSVYMISDQVQCPVTEDQAGRARMKHWPENPFGMDYGIGKRACEEILWKKHNAKDFPVTILRPTFVSGPNDPARRDFFWAERILDGQPIPVPGCGDFCFQNVYVGDVARVLADLADKPCCSGQAYNIAAEEQFSLREYLAILSDLLNKPLHLQPVPGDVFYRQRFSRHPNGDVFPYNTQRTAVFSLDKIKRATGYKSTPFRQWMAETLDWFIRQQSGHSYGYENRKAEVAFCRQYEKRVREVHSIFD